MFAVISPTPMVMLVLVAAKGWAGFVIMIGVVPLPVIISAVGWSKYSTTAINILSNLTSNNLAICFLVRLVYTPYYIAQRFDIADCRILMHNEVHVDSVDISMCVF